MGKFQGQSASPIIDVFALIIQFVSFWTMKHCMYKLILRLKLYLGLPERASKKKMA